MDEETIRSVLQAEESFLEKALYEGFVREEIDENELIRGIKEELDKKSK